MRHSLPGVALAVALAVSPRPAAAGEIIVDFFASPGTGFADPTPTLPVGGNPGLTLGQQRIFVFLQAAAIWTEVLHPTQDIFVAAQFVPLAPNVLGSAGAVFIWSNFPGAELPDTWYFDSLADHLAQADLSPTTYDIVASFSTNFVFYLGLDNAETPGTVDLLPVVLHEMGHGLNFANAVTEATGARPLDFGDIYSEYTLDVTTFKGWNQMNDAERQASALNTRHVSWSGLHANLAAPKVLDRGEPVLTINSPSGLGPFAVGTASFGPPLTAQGLKKQIVLGLDAADAAGPSTTDGCTALTNAAAVAGKFALLDRGTCAFTVKVKNAQDAGAAGVIIADNVLSEPPPGLGGADPTIVIPSVRISLTAGNAIKAAASPVTGTLKLDLSVRAGTDRVLGLVMLAAFNPVLPGSSISHYEPVAFPNLLMEPAINNDLTSSVQPPEDLTLPLLTDLGWFTDRDGVQDGRDACLGSANTPTVEIGSCVSTAPNVGLFSGCNVSDAVKGCEEGTRSRRKYLQCVETLATVLRLAHVLTPSQAKSLVNCAKVAGGQSCDQP